MALVRNAANTLRKGRIGETTYYTSKGRQIARQSLNNSNYGESARRSLAQQRRRVKWANLVNFYKLCSGWMPKAFETKKPGQTDYNKFMQLNVNAQRVALTRDQAINGGCVADAFAITQGTIPSCTHAFAGGAPETNLRVPNDFTLGDQTTVGEFATALINANPVIKEGMQLSVVVVAESEGNNNIPRCDVSFYEVVLSTASTELVSKYIASNVLSTDDGILLMPIMGVSGKAGAVILSEQTENGLKVSSETLAGTFTKAGQFATDAVVDAAIATYGLDKEVILNPDSAEPIA